MPIAAFPTDRTSTLLAGKRALVTGGASGIGAAIAALFALSGATVVVADIGAAVGTRPLAGPHGDVWHCDVASEESVATLAAHVGGPLHVLVNCAGVPQSPTPIEAMDVVAWDRIMAVNTRSLFLTTKHFLPHLRAAGAASIVNICSNVGLRPKAGLAAYGASKAAAIAVTRSLALELASEGIRVNAINPGATQTPMLSGFTHGTPVAQASEAFATNIPMGEIIHPDDVAGAALYLASDLARLVTGAAIEVDGGRAV